MGSSVNAHGGRVVPGFAKYVAELQRDEAFTLKQRRQWHEEQDFLLRRTAPGGRIVLHGGGSSSNQPDAGAGKGGGKSDGRGRGPRRPRGRGGKGDDAAAATAEHP